jgi:phage terminase small subunit
MKTLTDRQERFVHEYIIVQNASAAAARAGYARNSRATQAARLMDDPLVRDRIIAELADLYGRLKLNAVEVLQRQVRAAYLDPARLFDAQQEAIPLHQLDEEMRDGLTVNYSRRTNGDQVMRVRQTPRHIALAVLQKRLDAFAKLQEATFAQSLEREEREAQAAREKEAALRPKPKSFFHMSFDLPAAAPVREDAPQAAAVVSAHDEATLVAAAPVQAKPAVVQVTAPLPAAPERAIGPAPTKAVTPAKAATPASASAASPVPASAPPSAGPGCGAGNRPRRAAFPARPGLRFPQGPERRLRRPLDRVEQVPAGETAARVAGGRRGRHRPPRRAAEYARRPRPRGAAAHGAGLQPALAAPRPAAVCDRGRGVLLQWGGAGLRQCRKWERAGNWGRIIFARFIANAHLRNPDPDFRFAK